MMRSLKSWIRGRQHGPFKPHRGTTSRRKPVTRRQLMLDRLEDRTVPNATLVKDINLTAVPTVDSLVQVGNLVYFANDDVVHGREVWTSDGTAAGTVLVKDINPGAGWSNVRSLTNVNGTL